MSSSFVSKDEFIKGFKEFLLSSYKNTTAQVYVSIMRKILELVGVQRYFTIDEIEQALITFLKKVERREIPEKFCKNYNWSRVIELAFKYIDRLKELKILETEGWRLYLNLSEISEAIAVDEWKFDEEKQLFYVKTSYGKEMYISPYAIAYFIRNFANS